MYLPWDPVFVARAALLRALVTLLGGRWAVVTVRGAVGVLELYGRVALLGRSLLIDELTPTGLVAREIGLAAGGYELREAPEHELRRRVVIAGATHRGPDAYRCPGWTPSPLLEHLCQRCSEPHEEHALEARLARALKCPPARLKITKDDRGEITYLAIGDVPIPDFTWLQLRAQGFPLAQLAPWGIP